MLFGMIRTSQVHDYLQDQIEDLQKKILAVLDKAIVSRTSDE